MMTHVLGIAAATAAVILCTLLPFLPGRYDSLAVPLSLMAQLFGKVGLLLVPVGALWLASAHWSRAAPRRQDIIAVAALIASSIVWGIVSLGAFMESVTLGLGALVLGAYALVRARRRFRSGTGPTPATGRAAPLYLVVVPVAVALVQRALAGPVTEFSRDRAIRNSAPLIADIERYRIANGRYPRSLVSVNRDYLPRVIGIKEYRYEPRGDAYNVLFEQLTLSLGTTEIVMYNPRDEQAMTSHALDVLQLTPEQLAVDQTRGHYAVRDARRPHWKYFWFD
jgi:hypothetical protein